MSSAVNRLVCAAMLDRTVWREWGISVTAESFFKRAHESPEQQSSSLHCLWLQPGLGKKKTQKRLLLEVNLPRRDVT